MIEQEDGIRYLWSLLRNPDPEVQATAAEAIHSCLDQTLVGSSCRTSWGF